MMWKRLLAVAAPVFAAASLAAPLSAAEATFTYRAMTLDTAITAAQAALATCRDLGYQVAVAVVDRGGNVQVLLRDRYAGPHTPDTAIGKAWTAVSFRTNTTELVELTQPGMPQAALRSLSGAVILGGGMKVEGGGFIIGGIGVSGAPGGSEDDKCAKAGIDAIIESVEF